jgi:hypothetical protein
MRRRSKLATRWVVSIVCIRGGGGGVDEFYSLEIAAINVFNDYTLSRSIDVHGSSQPLDSAKPTHSLLGSIAGSVTMRSVSPLSVSGSTAFSNAFLTVYSTYCWSAMHSAISQLSFGLLSRRSFICATGTHATAFIHFESFYKNIKALYSICMSTMIAEQNSKEREAPDDNLMPLETRTIPSRLLQSVLPAGPTVVLLPVQSVVPLY